MVVAEALTKDPSLEDLRSYHLAEPRLRLANVPQYL